MEVNELLSTLAAIARPLGYRRKGMLFWKRHAELTTLIHLQRSRWSGGVYINMGATPNAMVTKPTPPGTGYWGVERRASAGSQFQDQFVRLERDATDVEADEMVEPLRWLVDWIEKNLADVERMRQEVLALEPGEIVSEMGWVTAMMRDWARGELRDPSVYFVRTPYYR